jgi:polyhydroxyalkanoate synthesis regulator phasin
MLELLRKSLLAGLGAGIITKEKAEETVREFVEQGKLSAEEGGQLVNRLLQSGNKQWEQVQVGVMDAVRKALDSADVASNRHVEDLESRLANVEQRLAMLENSAGTSEPPTPEEPID